MAQSTFSNFKYQVDKTPFNKTRNVTVSFDYNGQPVKKVLVFKDKKNANYAQDAKKIIEQERKNGTLDKYCKKYIKPKASPLTVALVSIAAVAALATTGLAAYTVAKGTGGGGDTPTPAATYYTVSFNTAGGSFVPAQKIEDGKKVSKPADPKKDGYKFNNWYDESGKEVWDFDAKSIKANTTIVAHWDILEYKITFHTDGGTWSDGTGTKDKVIDTKYSEMPNPGATVKKDGYVFTGWSDGLKPATKDDDYTAQWEAAPTPTTTHTLTYHFDNNATISLEETYIETYEEKVTIIEPKWVPSYAGHIFKGWVTERDGTEEFKFDHSLEKDEEAFAKWDDEPVPTVYHTVEFDTRGGDHVDSMQVEDGETIAEADKPTAEKEGYVDTDVWYYNDGTEKTFTFGTTTVTSDMTLYCKWTKDVFSATFDPGEGGSWKTGDDPTEPRSFDTEFGAIPTDQQENIQRAGYTFTGWKRTSDEGIGLIPMTADGETYTAQWALTPVPTVYHTVEFDSRGGTYVSPVPVEDGKTILSAPPTTREGYVDTDVWFIDDSTPFVFGSGDDATKVTEDMTLYCKWTKDVFSATFDPGEGGSWKTGDDPTEPRSFDTEFGAIPTDQQENIQRAGYTFTGWKRTSDEGIGLIPMTADGETYTAQWTQDTPSIFAVNFYTYDEDGDDQPDIWKTEYIEEGKDAIEPAARPTPPTGKEFIGWFENEQGEGDEDIPFVFDDNPIQEETNIYAHFGVPVQITINDPFSSDITTETMISGAPLVFPDYEYQIAPSGDARTGVTKWVDKKGDDAPATVPETDTEYHAIVESIPFDFTVDCTGTSFTIEGKSKYEGVYDYGSPIQVGFDGPTFPDATKIQIELIDRQGNKIPCESEWYTYDSTYGTITIQTDLTDDDDNPIFGQIRYINVSVSA